MNDKVNAALKEVALGMDAEVFLSTDLGKAMMEAVARRAMESMDRLKVIRPSDYPDLEQFVRAVQDLQNDIQRAEGFEQWLVEIVETGRNVEENLIQQEAHEQG